jgi:hypothetical protein
MLLQVTTLNAGIVLGATYVYCILCNSRFTLLESFEIMFLLEPCPFIVKIKSISMANSWKCVDYCAVTFCVLVGILSQLTVDKIVVLKAHLQFQSPLFVRAVFLLLSTRFNA